MPRDSYVAANTDEHRYYVWYDRGTPRRAGGLRVSEGDYDDRRKRKEDCIDERKKKR